MSRSAIGTFLVAASTAGWISAASDRWTAGEFEHDVPVAGNPAVVLHKYEAWKAAIVDEDPALVVGLHGSKGRSVGRPGTSGWASIDLRRGRVAVEVSGPFAEPADVWLVESGSRGRARHLGALVRPAGGGPASLTRNLERQDFGDFELDRVVITTRGRSPAEGAWLHGTPTLFQRMFFEERMRGAEPAIGVRGASTRTARAASVGEQLAALVLEGERIFRSETFKGNGRTCATCHPPDNNFTIDPEFIASLPPSDPLFVAEDPSSPLHQSNTPGGHPFEIPSRMRSHALILVNADGFPESHEPPRYVLRSVPHLFGMQTSRIPNDQLTPPNERLGWSGDGSPFDPDVGCPEPPEAPARDQICGTLRDFAIGAVVQHAPRTLQRKPARDCEHFQDDDDFCLPTADQLSALEAFQLSLGRQADPDLEQLVLRDALAAEGMLKGFTGIRCSLCHENAGATMNLSFHPDNANRTTGVEAFLQIHEPDPLRPPDGGFGWDVTGSFPYPPQPQDSSSGLCPILEAPGPIQCFPSLNGSFGNHSFNVPSIIEAADTPPFFHNNMTVGQALDPTLEGAMSFYFDPIFLAFRGTPVGLLPEDVEPVARFLRVVNSLDNIDSQAAPPVQRAICVLLDPERSDDVVPQLAHLATAHLEDILEVLGQEQDPPLHPEAVPKLESAIDALREVADTVPDFGPAGERITLLEGVLGRMCLARGDLEDSLCPFEIERSMIPCILP